MKNDRSTAAAVGSLPARLPAPAVTAELLQRSILADASLRQAIVGAVEEMPWGRNRRVLRRLAQQLADDPTDLDRVTSILQEVPTLVRATLHTGMESGQLVARLSEVAACDRQNRSHAVRIISAVAYPAFLLMLSMGLLAFLCVELLPALGMIGGDGGEQLEHLVWWGATVRSGLQCAALLVGASLVLVAVVPLVSGRLGWSILWWSNPVCGTLFHWQFTIGYLQSLTMLLRQELPLPDALSILSADRPGSVAALTSRAVESAVRRGMSLADAMRQTGLYPTSCLPFVEWGESHGRLVSGLEMAQQMLAARLRHAADWLNTLIPMIVYLLVGLAVLLVIGVMSSAIVQSLRWLM